MKPLDPFIIDLEKTTLIEASAGTGKTYTITTLYCRLAAMGYPVESILVVTFTEAAAAELKLRIRSRLFNTLVSLLGIAADRFKNLSPHLDEDDLVRFLRSHENLPLVCQRLSLALNSFDQTSIMTIHSFCLKILKENAFESHSLFDIELMPDRSSFLRQVSYDFFMGYVNNLDTLFLSYLNQQQITPESFAASFGPFVSRSDLVCLPLAESFENISGPYRKTLKKIHDILLTREHEIIDLIQNHKGIDKRSYTKKNVPVWLEASCLKIDQQGVDTFFKMTEDGDSLYKFTQTRLELKTKFGEMPPEHEFFDLCEQMFCFYKVFENNLISLKIEFLAFFNKELDKMKKAQGICFFDDLVNDLAKALEKQDAHNLQKAVRQTYKACLIDEFQDTDPRQYDIFSKFFSPQGTPFFMIGDPKQAIYAFRGGDIFAYLKASKESDQKFTLEKNYRSAPLLVKAINEVFSGSIKPFLYEPIKFLKVKTPETAKNFLKDNEEFVPPLQFCFLKREGQDLDRQGFISKDNAAGIIPKIVAADMQALLHSDKSLIDKGKNGMNPQKISPEDIAVLVRTNKQAEQIKMALSDLNIPSYLSKTGSVFDASQAMDLHDILWAVNNPDNKGYIHAALCTSVFGFSSDKIVRLDKKEDLFFRWQDQFREYKQIWETKGFVSMAMALFHSDEAFLKGNMSLDERGMTNFYHLIELISQACLKQQLSPYYLLKWYARQLFKELRDEFADELRLESDKKAVAIITIHKSKGLEYPVVYLPYLWEGPRKTSQENILFHDPEKDYQLTLDLGSTDLENSQTHFEKEDRAEQRRLLYVALTRASAMCRIIWGGFKSVETSALGTLLHSCDCKDDQLMIKDLEQLSSRADQSILLQQYFNELSKWSIDRSDSLSPVLSAEKISRDIKASWKMSSFSAIALSQNQEALQERQKSDGDRERPITCDLQVITLAQFPKGAGSGDLFHSIFETLDFTMGSREISTLVQSKFDMFGFVGTEMIQMADKSVKEVLGTKLVHGTSGFCLKDILPDQRFNELEFAFSVPCFQMSSVQKTFEQSDVKFKTSGYINKLSQLTAQSFKGFIKGFIDLVIRHKDKWYIVDYKSNYLGDTYDQYSQTAMFDAMSDHHYFLQYHIYLVALHRYLGLRLKDYDYDTHFGGVFYLFIRGMHPDFASHYGVFYDRPTKDVVNCLSDNL
ncbi:exodeoxyribonuclease V subunit beta [Desulfobacula sp.]|uniref:exodeoxyribonuclease V subunit beta n=1 Tax=Desulfobacula sp. TaxID=2593537 RepID=UPI001ECC9EE3|nr:exodeoxyribonuclease V subunit beta [Desulfobacula sp.]